MTYYFNGEERILNVALVNQIEKILAGIKLKIITKTEQKEGNCVDIVLQATYKGLPADGLWLD
jgi:hypothetical protein